MITEEAMFIYDRYSWSQNVIFIYIYKIQKESFLRSSCSASLYRWERGSPERIDAVLGPHSKGMSGMSSE